MHAFGHRCLLRVEKAKPILFHWQKAFDIKKMHRAPVGNTWELQNARAPFATFSTWQRMRECVFCGSSYIFSLRFAESSGSCFSPKTLVKLFCQLRQSQSRKWLHLPILALLANPSLNRTLCGGPRLAIISFLAKPGPPQSAG